MATPIIIYDPDREIACMVDGETQQGWGPAMIGPDAYDALLAFTTAMPMDIGTLPPDTVTELFRGFVAAAEGGATDAPAEAPASALDSAGPAPVDAGEALAEATATAASDTPEPQPADTDETPAPSTSVRVVDCYSCGGEGVVHFGGDEPDQRCNMCQGTGKIAQAA